MPQMSKRAKIEAIVHTVDGRPEEQTQTTSRSIDKPQEVDPIFDTTIDALDDYFLLTLFSYLSVKEKLAIERVSKRWQRIILNMLVKQTGLGTTWTTDEDTNCLDHKRYHSVNGGDIRAAVEMSNGWFYDFTDRRTLANFKHISKKCPHVKCFHISHGIIDSQSLEQIRDMFPDCECLHLKSNVLKLTINEANTKDINNEWAQIGRALGLYITHLSIDPHYEFRMNEVQLMNLLKHFQVLEEFRVGTHFERDVSGKFLAHLSPKCRLFYSLGREFSMDSLETLAKNNGRNLTHMSFFSNTLRSAENLRIIGQKFDNLVKLKVNLSFTETILTTPSPISQLKNLKEFAIDLNPFTDSHVDDGLIWCIKDGLPSVETLEISRACLSSRAFNSIQYCLPQLTKLVLKTVEIQCNCQTLEFRDRPDRYKCDICKSQCWQSVALLHQLRALHILGYYFRTDKPKSFHSELSKLLPTFKALRVLEIFHYDISDANLIESLNQLMEDTDTCDRFRLYLKSVPMDHKKVKAPKLFIYRDSFML